MKTKTFLPAATILLSATLAFGADSLSENLQKGLFEEEANHNLDVAIKAYQAVLDQSQEQRKIAATALFRLGECYRKLNQTNDAVGYYQRLVREFPDQTMLANLSKQNLSVLGGGGKSDSTPASAEAALTDEAEALQRIRVMIKDSPDLINGRGLNGITPLHEAAAAGQMSVARFLLTNGADVNARDNADGTALHRAAWKGHRAMCELLLTNGANVNAIGSYGGPHGTALHLAVRNGYQAVSQTLLQYKANPNAQDKDGHTPLHLAAGSDSVAMLQLLIKGGANLNPRDNKLNLPIHEAATRPSIPIAKALIEAGAKLDQPGQYGYLPLHSAIRPGQAEMARLLLESGSDVNARSDGGYCAVHLAPQKKAEDVLRVLLDFKPNLEPQTDYGSTPLFLAIDAKTPGAVKLLLEAGANPNGQNRSGQFPLIVAVSLGQTEITALLLAHKADPNAINPDGATALAVVRPSGNVRPRNEVAQAAPELEKLLIKHGADENINRRRFIGLRRDGHPVWNFFTKDEHGSDEPSLSQLIAYYYQGRNASSTWSPYPFPDLARLSIERLVDQGKATNRIPVALDKGMADITLQWGDIVTIPEQDHHLSQSWNELPKDIADELEHLALKTITVHVQGKATDMRLRPELRTNLRQQSGLPVSLVDDMPMLRWPTLQYVVRRSGVLRASSDVTRVKVSRREPDGQKRRILFYNLDDKKEDIWLQDGDIIEIPDKES